MTPIESHSHGPRPWARLPFGRHPFRDAQRDQQVDAHQRTGRVLLTLPSAEWSVVGSSVTRADVSSHVLVGSAGVYMILACKPEGCVRVKDGVPWSRRGAEARGERAHTDINRRVLEPAQVLEREMRARNPRCPAVHPVVVLWSEFPQRVAETNRITFVHGRDLAGWLRGRQGELDNDARLEVTEIAGRIGQRSVRKTLRSSRAVHAA